MKFQQDIEQGGGTGGPTVRVGVVGDIRRNDKGGGGHPLGVFPSDLAEAGKASGKWGMGYTSGGGIHKEIRDTVGGQVHRPPAGNSCAVGGPAYTS